MGNFSSALLLFVILLVLRGVISGLFQFKRYTYRKKSGNERKYRLQEERCQNMGHCKDKVEVDKEKCVKICVSSSCYEELYSWNELEEGEIDVRSSSFKGCVVQQIREREMQERRNSQL